MSYIGADELVFYNDKEKGIHSGGFSVNSIMMKEGRSPIITLNNNQNGGKRKRSHRSIHSRVKKTRRNIRTRRYCKKGSK
jgi:hypothetical protein